MLPNLSLKHKSVLVIATLLLMTIVPLVATREKMTRRYLQQRMDSSARTTKALYARVIAEPLAAGDLAALRKITVGLSNDPDFAYVVIFGRGNRPVFVLNKHVAAPPTELRTLGDPSVGSVNDGIYDVAEPVVYQARRIGYVNIGFTTANLTRDVLDARKQGIIFGLAAFIAALFITYGLISRGFLEPLEELMSATRAMTEGDLNRRVRVRGRDEIGQLGTVFNDMAQSIQESHAHLEHRVAQRTEELSQANERLRESERQLQAANQELAAANRLKSEFLANMSHELRTPLNAIIGFSELLQDQVFGPLTERQSRYVSNILTSGRHLLQLINDILDLSKIEAGRMELHLESFKISEAVSEVETIVQPLANRKRVDLRVELSDEAPPVVADRSKLKQIMYNLLSNAIKFTREGGWVTVRDAVVGGQLRVSVSDTGIGIRPEDQSKIFQEFRQADGSAARQYEGTGLGLALTKRFVQMHGGTIWVESEVEKGSTFHFTLPLQPPRGEGGTEQPASDSAIPGSESASMVGPLVLVVEDDPQSRELLALALTQAGYRVATASDGDEAMRKACELLPFAVTLDIMLPKRDGWQVLRDLKSRPETEGIPVVIVSITDNRELGFSLGAADYFVKPVDRGELLRKLGRFSFTTKVKTQNVRVLCIDDDPNCVDLVSSLLSSEGFEVLKAYGGQEGLDKALSLAPDAIILDLMMPSVTGFDVLRELKQHGAASQIPVFVLTAMDLTDEVRDELTGQVVAVASKGGSGTEELIGELAKLQRLRSKIPAPLAPQSMNAAPADG